MSKTIALTLKLNGVETSIKNMDQLEQSIKDLEGQLSKADFGSEEFQDLSKELVKARNQVRDLDKELEGLDTIQRTESFLKLGEGIAGAFAIGQGAIGLFGEESEELEKTMVKVQSAISIAVGARAAAEGLLNARIAARIVQEKLLAAQMTITNVVVGSSTGALKAFRIALASTGVGLLVIALGSLIANFEDVKKWIDENVFSLTQFGNKLQEVGSGIKTFFSEVGGSLADFFTGDFRGAVNRITNLPDEVIQSAKDTSTRIQNELAEEQRREKLRLDNEQLRRDIQLIEAQGRDTYRVKERLLRQELELLERGSKEYQDKLNEIRILNINQQKQIQEQAIKNQQELNKNLIEELNRNNESIKFLSDVDIPQVEGIERLNKILDRQRDILTNTINPLEKFKDSFKEVDVPEDQFGAYFNVLKKILDQGITTKTTKEFNELSDALLDLTRRFGEGLSGEELDKTIDEFSRFYFDLQKVMSTDGLVRPVSEQELEFGLRQIAEGFSPEAVRATEVLIKSGYNNLNALIGRLNEEQTRNFMDIFEIANVQDLGRDLTLEFLEGGQVEFKETFIPFNPDFVDSYKTAIKQVFELLYGELNEDNASIFESFSKNVDETLKGIANQDREIKAVFNESLKLQNEVNNNLQEGSLSRLKIVSDAYVEYVNDIKQMDEEYLLFNRDQIIEELKQVQERYNQEVKLVKENSNEKNQLVLDSVTQMVELEEYLTQIIQQEEEKRKSATTNRLMDTISEYQGYIDRTLDVVNKVGDMVRDLTDLQLQESQRRYETELDLLDARLQSELEGVGNNERLKNRIREKYDKERLKAEEEYEKEQRKIRKKQLTLDLFSNVLGIVSETARNIVEVFPNPFLMGLAGTIGAAQLGVATKVYNQSKKLRRGGMLKGPSHSQGGIPMGDYEVEGGELILPREVGQNNSAMGLVNQAMILSGNDPLNKEVGRFDSQVMDEMRGYFNKTPIIKTYVVSGDIERESVINKQIEDRSKL